MSFGSRKLGLRVAAPFEPILAEKLDRVLSPNGAIAAAQIVGRAILVATPADSLRVFGMESNFRLGHYASTMLGSSYSSSLRSPCSSRKGAMSWVTSSVPR